MNKSTVFFYLFITDDFNQFKSVEFLWHLMNESFSVSNCGVWHLNFKVRIFINSFDRFLRFQEYFAVPVLKINCVFFIVLEDFITWIILFFIHHGNVTLKFLNTSYYIPRIKLVLICQCNKSVSNNSCC